MKKTSLLVILCISLILSLTACGSSNKGSVVLGDYEKIEIAKSDVEITDANVDEYIASLLNEKATTETITEGTVESGDTINISYTGYIDGETFEGGTAENTSITIGSSGYIDGFDNGLIGAAIGSTVDLNLTFPDPYANNTDLSGKPVVFKVTVNSKDITITPELTAEWVTTNYSTENLTTVEEFKAYTRKSLEENALQNAIWNAVFADVKVESYDKKEVESLSKEEKEYYETNISSNYGMILSDYLTLIGTTEEDFNKQIDDSVKEYLKQKMTVYAIAEKEELAVTDEEYDAELQNYVDYYGYESIDKIKEELSQSNLERVKLSLLAQKVMKILQENIVLVDKVEETTAASEETTTN